MIHLSVLRFIILWKPGHKVDKPITRIYIYMYGMCYHLLCPVPEHVLTEEWDIKISSCRQFKLFSSERDSCT